MVVQLVSAGSFCGRDHDTIRGGCATSAADSVFSARSHGALGDVAAVGDLQFVVGLDQDRSGESEQGGGAEEVPASGKCPQPTTSVRRFSRDVYRFS